MPTYEYACRECGEHLEVVQKFTDDPLTTCPACTGSLRKVFSSIGISFKGSGFYKNDSRTTGAGKKESGEGSSESKSDADKPKAEAKGDTKSDASKGDSSKGDSGKKDTGKKDTGKKDTGSSTAAAS